MISFSYSQLAWFILFCLAVCVGILLIIALVKINRILYNFKKTYESNNENIDKTLSILPETVENVNDIVVTVKENINKAGAVIGIDTSENSSTVFNFLKIITEVLLYIKNTFFSSEKDS